MKEATKKEVLNLLKENLKEEVLILNHLQSLYDECKKFIREYVKKAEDFEEARNYTESKKFYEFKSVHLKAEECISQMIRNTLYNILNKCTDIMMKYSKSQRDINNFIDLVRENFNFGVNYLKSTSEAVIYYGSYEGGYFKRSEYIPNIILSSEYKDGKWVDVWHFENFSESDLSIRQFTNDPSKFDIKSLDYLINQINIIINLSTKHQEELKSIFYRHSQEFDKVDELKIKSLIIK